MEFRILGPLEVVDGGQPVAVHRGKEQALLAYLLLHANELVPTDRLIDELWGERPPPTVRKNLQNAVSQLRKSLGNGRLVTQPPGYRFRVDPGELDLHRFEQLVAQGRKEGNPELLREALEIWRGEPLANLRDELFVQRAAVLLEEARVAVVEDRIDADLADGCHTQLVPELEQLIAAHPLRERPYGQLMLAFYGAGRQADALEAYQRARKTLNRELGLEPSPQLQELERRILNQDPDLEAAPARPSTAASRARRTPRLRSVIGAALLVSAAVAGALVLTNGGRTSPTVVPNSLVKIDPDTNRVVDVIPVGRQPTFVTVAGPFVWVVNDKDATVTRVDATSGAIRTIGGLKRPTGLAAHGNDVWVSTSTHQQVIRVQASTGKADLRAPLGRTAFMLAVGAGSLWVTEPWTDDLSRPGAVARVDLATGKVVRTFRVALKSTDVTVGAGAVWVTNAGSLARIDLADGSVEQIPVGLSPGPVATGFGSVWFADRVWISNQTVDIYNSIWRFDPATRRAVTVTVGRAPFAIAVGRDAVWVTNRGDGTVMRIDPRTNKVVKTIRLRYKPQGIAAGAGAIWVAVGQGDLPLPF
jgi:YVTN family beta-propeller protein